MSPPARPLHVLMTADAVGGVWVYATSLARSLCEEGHQVTLVILGPAPRADQLRSLRSIARLKLHITDLDLEWMEPDGKDLPRALETLAAIERRVKPDVIHLNGYREATGDWAAPVLVAAHSCVGSWWQACRPGTALDDRWQRYAANVAAGLAAADIWIAPTAAYRDEVRRLYAPPTGGRVIWNGLGGGVAPSPKEPFILAAGRLWDEGKNIAVLDGIARNLDWPVRAAGSLRPPHDDGCAAAVPDLDILGELPREGLRMLMNRAAIFVSPAVYEPFGLTVLEAAAAGCALVLSGIPTFHELWDGAALFVNPRDASVTRDALQYLCCNKMPRETLQQSARLRAQRYSLPAMACEYLNAYEILLNSTSSPARISSYQPVEARP